MADFVDRGCLGHETDASHLASDEDVPTVLVPK